MLSTLPADIENLTILYLIRPRYKPVNFLDMKKINPKAVINITHPLVSNPRAFDWLNSQKYVWSFADILTCPNPRALKKIKTLDLTNTNDAWEKCVLNPDDEHLKFLLNNFNKLPGKYIYMILEGLLNNLNPCAIEIFLELVNKIDTRDIIGSLKFNLAKHPDPRLTELIKRTNPPYHKTGLCSNTNPLIIQFVLAHPESINYEVLSHNPSDLAVDYLIAHPYLINWSSFSLNIHPKAIEFCKSFGNITELTGLVRNYNSDGFKLFVQTANLDNLTNVETRSIASNPCDLSIDLMESKPEIFLNNIYHASYNPNPRIINLVKTHIDKIYRNPHHGHLLARTDLFELDKSKMFQLIKLVRFHL